MGEVRSKVVVVLGMHRSGTSAIARSLEVLGIRLGDALHPAASDNPKGFWEDVDCLQINEQLLASVGSAYDRLHAAWGSPGQSEQFQVLKARAVRTVTARLHDHGGIWGFKDPRTCRFMGFWQSVFREVDCDVAYVVAIRNPVSVAASLAGRNHIHPVRSYQLWLQHVVPALVETAGSSRVVVDYDLLLEHPLAELSRMARDLGVRFPGEQDSEVRAFVGGFLGSELRHDASSVRDLRGDVNAPADAVDLYEVLRFVAEGKLALESVEASTIITRAETGIRSARQLYAGIDTLDVERIVARQDATFLHEQLNDREARLIGQNAAVEDLARQLADEHNVSKELFRETMSLLQHRDAQIDSLLHDAYERNRRLDELNNELDQRIAAVHRLDSELQRLVPVAEQTAQELAWRNRDVQRLSAQITAMANSTSWRVTRPVRLLGGLLKGDPRYSLRAVISRGVRGLWGRLPLSASARRRIKNFLFSWFGFAFFWSAAYRNWQAARDAAATLGPRSVFPVAADARATFGEYVELLQAQALAIKPARLICFYLPQFHPIAENNAWWGEGFTEWTNVRPAQPQFEGHYQPHVPGELGYYDLRDTAVQRRQVELARLYGIEGFCFYFYWFGGKRLLELPIENYLADRSLDLPFCLCWANENWSRRWDGLDKEILIAQNHSPEDDIGFISHVAKYMADPRYIRIDGRPLLLVYRPSLLPNAPKTAARWRAWCRDNGLGEIYLAYTQSFEKTDPSEYGFDAAIEFPPNNSSPPDITTEVQPLGDFRGTVYDWRIFPKRSEEYQQPGYTLFRSVCPSWDNTARRKNRGTIFQHSSPAEYRRWLANAIDDTVAHRASPDERLIFVNAWNEWAEGAHLEPDARYGYAFLQATRDALAGPDATPTADAQRRVIVVTHDAYPHGAQLLALNLARTFNSEFGFRVDLVCLGDGPLKTEYAKWATVHDLAGRDPRGPEAIALAQELSRDGARHAVVNTTASGHFLGTLKGAGITCVALVHELRGVLDQLGLHEQAKAIAGNADSVVFPASCVAESFSLVAPLRADATVIRPQGLYKRRKTPASAAEDRRQLRARLGLPKNCRIVLGVGYADHRKGVDLFVDAGIRLAGRLPDARWVWIGHWEQTMQAQIERTLARHPHLKDRFVFPGLQSDTDLFYGGSDLFALTSREDPYPSVVLEAMDAGVPVIAFEGSGGIAELVADGGGLLVRMTDVDAFGAAVAQLLGDEQQRVALGLRGKEIIATRFSFRHYLFDLLDLLGAGLKRVSVIVPNYNYERYLPERLGSIVGQTYPVYEIIFLDDCSADGSLERAREILAAQPVDYRIVANERNSGSVFVQWKRGVDLARGSQVWIAEADDVAHPEFLATATRDFAVPGMAVSYCESRQIDGEGRVMAGNYLDYVADISAEKWRRPYIGAGIEEIRTALAVKNTIPNVSAVLFDSRRLQDVLDRHIEEIRAYRVAGDWLVYVLMLADGKIGFSPRPLNDHRRHAQGVTISGLNESQLDEIRSMQRYVAEKFPVPVEVSDRADAYVETLKAQIPTG